MYTLSLVIKTNDKIKITYLFVAYNRW